VQREEALRILGLDAAHAKDFTNVRRAYHRRMRAVHPDLNPHPNASEATAMVSAAYDLLYRANRAARTAEARRMQANSSNGHNGSTNGTSGAGSPRRTGSRARVLNDSTLTVMGEADEVFGLVLAAARALGEVSHAAPGDGMIAVVAEFLHAPPCSVTLQVARRGSDRSHVRCEVEAMSNGDPPPVAAVTRLLARTIGELQSAAAP